MEELIALTRALPGATLLLAATVLASLIGLFAAPSMIERNLFRPFWLMPHREYATLISSAFLHADLAHLFFNAFTFWAFAFPLERAIGTADFLALYFFGMLASDLGTYFEHPHDPNYKTLGASGAILAMLFASIVYSPSASILIFQIPSPFRAGVCGCLPGLQLLRVTPCSRRDQSRCTPRRGCGRHRFRRIDGPNGA